MPPSSDPCSPPLPSLGRRLAIFGLVSLLIVGCVRLLEPRSSNITYYMLDSDAAADTAVTDTTGLTLGLRRVELASYLDDTRIVTRHGSNTVQFSDRRRWGEDLHRALNRVVALNLEATDHVQSVNAVPWPKNTAFDYVVQLRVLRFEGIGPRPPGPDADDDVPIPRGHSQMVVRWTIVDPDGETTRAKGLTRHREDNWPVTDFADLAAKLDTSLVVLSNDLGDRLRTLSRR